MWHWLDSNERLENWTAAPVCISLVVAEGQRISSTIGRNEKVLYTTYHPHARAQYTLLEELHHSNIHFERTQLSLYHLYGAGCSNHRGINA